MALKFIGPATLKTHNFIMVHGQWNAGRIALLYPQIVIAEITQLGTGDKHIAINIQTDTMSNSDLGTHTDRDNGEIGIILSDRFNLCVHRPLQPLTMNLNTGITLKTRTQFRRQGNRRLFWWAGRCLLLGCQQG